MIFVFLWKSVVDSSTGYKVVPFIWPCLPSEGGVHVPQRRRLRVHVRKVGSGVQSAVKTTSPCAGATSSPTALTSRTRPRASWWCCQTTTSATTRPSPWTPTPGACAGSGSRSRLLPPSCYTSDTAFLADGSYIHPGHQRSRAEAEDPV